MKSLYITICIYAATCWFIQRPSSFSCSYLNNSTEVTVGGQLQPLLLRPGLYVAQLLPQDGAPVVAAQARVFVRHQLVEEPHVDEVEELRKELDGQGGVDPTSSQQRHGPRQSVQDVLYRRQKVRSMSGSNRNWASGCRISFFFFKVLTYLRSLWTVFLRVVQEGWHIVV